MTGAYLELIRIRFMTMLAYRMNYYNGIIIYAINIGAYYFLWQAIYSGRDELAGLTAGQMTTYVAVSWMARAFYFNNLDREISNEIRDGSLAIQMIRPYHYLVVKMMQALGEGLFRLLLFTIPGLAVALLLFPVKLPADPAVWAMFFVMIGFSFLIHSQINMLTGLCAFYLENNEGLMRMKRVAVDLLSGLVIPVSLFPGWAETIVKWLPFQAITYVPGSVFASGARGADAWQALGLQAFWCAVLLVPIALLWRSARRRLFVQGG
ncbi:ABC transporter permease [Paenibacillus thermoaerophilus]|uniref:ABC transporter permease n=1 Tax=Paenibacillus thermoaerophilus TaxID=1215385 RepID=A0ABW2V4D4_9BACL|nr:ABC-2 family transporter protein [Paenibacillus thermoaerophilus]TMV13929.1 daunorubicin ABC transporter permease [Paenibacillus thermoaerophilus]